MYKKWGAWLSIHVENIQEYQGALQTVKVCLLSRHVIKTSINKAQVFKVLLHDQSLECQFMSLSGVRDRVLTIKALLSLLEHMLDHFFVSILCD